MLDVALGSPVEESNEAYDSEDKSATNSVAFDHVGASELLSVDLGVTDIRGTGSFYSPELLHCLGSARAVRASPLPVDPSSLIPA